MPIRDMPHITVEQVLRLRDTAAHIEAERDALARKLAMIEFTWDQCEGVPNRDDSRELHRIIIETEPHVDDELQALRRESGGSS